MPILGRIPMPGGGIDMLGAPMGGPPGRIMCGPPTPAACCSGAPCMPACVILACSCAACNTNEKILSHNLTLEREDIMKHWLKEIDSDQKPQY